MWGKKLEKQIQSGVDVKDLTARAEKRRQEERLVCCFVTFSDKHSVHCQVSPHVFPFSAAAPRIA